MNKTFYCDFKASWFNISVLGISLFGFLAKNYTNFRSKVILRAENLQQQNKKSRKHLY